MKTLIAMDIPRARLEVVHLGVDPLPYLSTLDTSSYEDKYKLKSHSPILLTVGGIKGRKGQFDVLKSLMILKKEYPSILYCMVASDISSGYVSAMRVFAKENDLNANMMLIDDAKDDKALSYFYNVCDVHLLTSTSRDGHVEGFGLALIEANQYGKPTVGSRGCGIEDAVKDGYSGFLVDQSDPADIAEKVSKILRLGTTSFSEHAKEFASRFTWSKTVAGYLSAYRE